ncbi:hypothetical protein M7I_7078 [Glarea lozoyensis 74030]|uniref:Uncharacterized protein n=1 Tax=Glarea lozoyensis (strain ATCC 74030 / MF5533) TaxID=1104152 RepID=H0EWB5_GLAL7|nr:hypothetical protein M7I_7078 [Glarea lozoyensis 74030]
MRQSLNDFKNTGCFPPFAYAYLVGSLVVSIAVYGVDTFTAVNLLAFDKWSGAIAPAIDLDVELTKSKKGAEYVALFTYFSFQSWIRIIFCQGPRQVINAVTLYAVFEANFEGKEDE